MSGDASDGVFCSFAAAALVAVPVLVVVVLVRIARGGRR